MNQLPLPRPGSAWQASAPDSRIAADIRVALGDGVLSFSDACTIALNVAGRGDLFTTDTPSPNSQTSTTLQYVFYALE